MNELPVVIILLLGLAAWSFVAARRTSGQSPGERLRAFAPGIGVAVLAFVAVVHFLLARGSAPVREPWLFVGAALAGLAVALNNSSLYWRLKLLIAAGGCILIALRT